MLPWGKGLIKSKIYPSIHFSLQANFISVYIWIKMVHAIAHDIPMQPNEIKRKFHNATISSKMSGHICIKFINSIYRMISELNYDIVG